MSSFNKGNELDDDIDQVERKNKQEEEEEEKSNMSTL
jgi:uncharacterized protein YdcH (DUF465 family)